MSMFVAMNCIIADFDKNCNKFITLLKEDTKKKLADADKIKPRGNKMD